MESSRSSPTPSRSRGWATPGTAPDSPGNAPQQVALAGVEVYVVEGSTCPPSPWPNDPNQLTGASGDYGPISTNLPALVGSRLTGDWVNVIDCDAGLCGQDTPTQCDLAQDPFTPPLDLTYGDGQTEFDTAVVNAFVQVGATHDWYAGLQPDLTGIDKQVRCYVNVPRGNGCNASYTPLSSPPTIDLHVDHQAYPETCYNAAFSTIISHEYGHFVLDQHIDAGGGMHEGVADTVATLMWNTECFGEDFSKDGNCMRNVDAVDRDWICFKGGEDCLCFDETQCTPEDPSGYDCADDTEVGCEVQLNDQRCGKGAQLAPHCLGQALAGAFWDVRGLLLDGQAQEPDWKTEDLFSNFLLMTMGLLNQSVLIEVLVADDDDGNLTNGTPNGQDILCAFVGQNAGDCSLPSAYVTGFQCAEIGHGWACPLIGDGGDGSVQVNWDGPITGDPVPPGDFTVNYDVNPPIVTLKSTEKGGLAVQKWYVGRKDPTTAKTLDLGAVYTTWTGTAYNIDVRIGTRPTEPCRTLDVVVIDRQSTDTSKYSNIVLNLGSGADLPDGFLWSRAQCYAGNAGGGLVSGSVSIRASRIMAAGIGEGAATPGQLDVGVLENTVFQTISSGSTLSVGGLGIHLGITDELAGTIDIEANLDARISIGGTGESTGDIVVGGNVTSEIYIAGDMSGDIRVTGDILGTVEIDGTFSGDICASNVTPGTTLPDNIDIYAFDLNSATVCGWPIECSVDTDCDDASSCTADSCDRIWCEHSDNGTCTGSAVCPASTPRPPHSAPKNRYISFNPTNDDAVAFEMRLTELQLSSCSTSGAPCRPDRLECDGDQSACTTDADCLGHGGNETCIASDCGQCSVSGKECIWDSDCGGTETCDVTGETCVDDQANSVGTTWWVGPPRDPSCEDLDDGSPIPGATCLGQDYVSRVVDTMYNCNDDDKCPWPATVHVGDCEIVPVASYEIRATPNGTDFSAPLSVQTIDKPTSGGTWWADGVGPSFNGLWWRPPDGATNLNDAQAGQHAFQTFGNYAHITWLDMHGSGFAGDLLDKELAPPNYLVNQGDLQFIELAFQGRPYPFADPGDCPTSPQGRSPGPDPITISVVADAELINPGDPVNVDVYIDDVDNLGAYEVALQVSGGTAGALVLTGITVDTQRTDYVFYGESPQITTDLAGGRTGATMTGGEGVTVTTSGYLATFTYQGVQGALGVFQISVVGGNASFLNDASGKWLDSVGGDAEVVGSGIDCYNDGHCDDSNDCTTDTCTSNECGYTNVASGTGCDDGLWCTFKGSTCDGNGNCTGGTPRCQPGEICDEQAQLCIGAPSP